jgi:hypothetical protein
MSHFKFGNESIFVAHYNNFMIWDIEIFIVLRNCKMYKDNIQDCFSVFLYLFAVFITIILKWERFEDFFIFWDITLCNSLKINWRFGEPYQLQPPSKWRRYVYVPAKLRLVFNEPHGVISPKVKPFITTPVRTSFPIRTLSLTALR